METRRTISKMDIRSIVDFTDRSIDKYSDDDLAELAAVVVSVIYESRRVEDVASYAVGHFLKEWYNADLRAKGGYDTEHNEMLADKYMRLVLFCAEKTQRLNYRLDDEAAGILKEIGLMPGGVAGGVGQTDTTTAEDAAQVDSPAGGVAKRDTLPNAGGVEPQGVAAIPDELNTEKAKKYLQMAVNGGLLNEDYSTTEKTKTKPQKALLAEILSERIGLSTKDSVFETLWGVKELRKARYKSKDAGKVRGEEEIYAVFPDARKRMR